VVLPSIEDGLAAPGLRFGDPRTMALLACLCCYQHLFAGLTNRSLREPIAGLIPGYSARQMTYDLRRLRRKHFIQRIPRTHPLRADQRGTPTGRLSHQDLHPDGQPLPRRTRPQPPGDIADRTPLAKAYRAFERAIDNRIKEAAIAA
jgi:hypothetical protein